MARPATRGSARTIVVISVLALVAQLTTAPVQAVDLPSVPRNLTAAAGGGAVMLSWLAPLDDGGAPIDGYIYGIEIDGVLVYSSDIREAQTSLTLSGPDDYIVDWGLATFILSAVNEAGQYGAWAESDPVFVWTDTPAPQLVLDEIPAAGGTVTTDPDGAGPTATNPVTTTVDVPSTAEGGVVTVAETAISWDPPVGFVLFGQEILISSTAPTDASNPLRIVFRVDPSLVPVTIFRDGLPITEACQPPVEAMPSPCIASGIGTDEISILTDHASRWNVGRRPYPFEGFFSPVDRPPVANLAKAGSTIPVRFSLGGDEGLNVFETGYPKSRRISCDAAAPDPVEETIGGPANALTYSAGTESYQFAWKTERSWAGTCRELIVRFAEGTEERAIFQFR